MKQIFINKFEKGSNENANIGLANLVGIDTYSKKGVAILAKKSTIVTTNFTAQPHFFETSQAGTYMWVQCADGSVLYTADGGSTWQATSTAFPTSGATHGNGLIFFQNYMFAFTDTKIYYWKDTAGATGSNPSSGAWVDWTSQINGATGSLQNFATDPISGLHFPFLYPNNRGVYFGNGGAGQTSNAITTASGASCTIGFFGQVGTSAFNPAGTRGTDFLWNNGILQLPSSTYTVGNIDFLPPSSLAISVSAYNNPSQGADLITWDTVSTNKFNPPIRIYSNTLSQPTGSVISTAGVKQLFNRNQVLYAITGGNHTVYETNGSSFNLVEDIGLYSNVRTTGGSEDDYPVYFNSYPQAITVVGNKLLTGVATNTNTTIYPPQSPSNTGIFPIGVWSIAFDKTGGHTIQCEFSLPKTNTLVSPDQHDNYAKITCIKPIPQNNGSTSQIAIGYGYRTLNENSGNPTFGVALVDLYSYIDNLNYTAIESELFEIGTALTPQAVGNIEINLVKNLQIGQTIDLAYRKGQDQDWTNIDTYNGDGTKNYYALTKNPIGATQFLQLRVRMATGGSFTKYSPQLRTVIITPMNK